MRACCAILLTAVVLFVAGGRETRAQVEGFGWITASASYGGISGFCDGAIMLEEYVPVAVFGVNKRPNDKGRYTYFLLLKHQPEKRTGLNLKMEFSSNSSGHGADGTTKLILSGKPVEFGYHFKADETTQALLEETVKIGGKDLTKGDPRVYLIDLTRDEVVYRPVLVDLPDEVPDLNDMEKKETWGRAVHRTIKQLREKSPEVQRFLTPRPGE
jgi:hypothetical protein